MKIIAIRGKNIASLEGEFVIDFTTEPLRSSGLFAISGPTGAGKSTLLDTMCLALFARTPRTDQARENDVKLADVSDSTLRQGDPRVLLRRGTVSGYAEVDFIALNGQSYRSAWSVRRARDKESGALQDFRMSLLNLSREKEEQGSKRELLARVSDLIGLSFEQFTRSVLLAQNDFSAFLKADQGEKASLLEKLTGTERYSAISQLIFEKSKTAREAYEQIAARVQGIELFTDEELEQLQILQKQAVSDLEDLKAASVAIEQKKKWFADLQFAQESVRLATNEFQEVVKQWMESRFRESYLQQIYKVQDARSLYDMVRSVQHMLADKRVIQKQVAGQLERTTETQRKIALQYQQSIQEEQLAEKQYARIEPELQQARRLDVRIEDAVRLLSESEPRLKDITEEKNACEKHQEVIISQLAVLEREIESLRLWKEQHLSKASVAEQCDVLLLHLSKAEQERYVVETTTRSLANEKLSVRKEEEQADLAKQKLKIQQAEALKQEDTFRILEKRLEQTDYDALVREIELFRAKREQYAYEQTLLTSENMISLRQKLTEDTPCPLCGSTQHPYAGADVHLSDSFSSLLEAVDRKLGELMQSESEYLSRRKQLAVLKDQHLLLYKTIGEMEKNLSMLTTSVSVLKNKIQGEEEVLYEKDKSFRQSLKSVDDLLGDDQWQAAWLLNPVRFNEQLKSFSVQWKQQEERLRGTEAGRERLRAEYSSQSGILPSLNKRFMLIKEETAVLEALCLSLKKERALVLEGHSADRVEKECKDALVLRKQQTANALSIQQDVFRQHEQEKGIHIQIVADLSELEARQESSTASLADWLVAYNLKEDSPLTEEQLSELLLKDTTWIQKEREELNHIQTLRITAETKLNEREKELTIHLALRPVLQIADDCTPDGLQQVLLEIESRQQQQSAVLNECLFKLRHNLENKEKIKNLEDEQKAIQVISEQWAKLNDLAGSSDGGKFRRIAQGYTLDILLSHANIQLRGLSNRYRLERVPETLALQVIDRDMCDEIRTVHSLSGGESFLVSLALALGLSSLSSNRMNVESLFIDEGFGSLDAETLRIALDALENLRTQGRKIGVISHVQDMTERIHVQIKVEKEGSGRSRLMVIG